ncbi:hypothetical protein [Evansella tamaricis]|uniref:Phage protein n=1 Tax=Evansella tamaricis TaxID=2069301 RepID=A0ABS6JL91_9BACI|nr:hypothetical protein [Evansella tamaricis]MBU9714432.1 hypothetical protein [Evansella tamaricis]
MSKIKIENIEQVYSVIGAKEEYLRAVNISYSIQKGFHKVHGELRVDAEKYLNKTHDQLLELIEEDIRNIFTYEPVKTDFEGIRAAKDKLRKMSGESGESESQDLGMLIGLKLVGLLSADEESYDKRYKDLVELMSEKYEVDADLVNVMLKPVIDYAAIKYKINITKNSK